MDFITKSLVHWEKITAATLDDFDKRESDGYISLYIGGIKLPVVPAIGTKLKFGKTALNAIKSKLERIFF